MIKTVESLDQARLLAQQELAGYTCRILVCSGTGCIATGSNKIHEIFENIVKDAPGVELVFSPCGGHDDETVYPSMTPEKAVALIAELRGNG